MRLYYCIHVNRRTGHIAVSRNNGLSLGMRLWWLDGFTLGM
jgi:hypothetical protein